MAKAHGKDRPGPLPQREERADFPPGEQTSAPPRGLYHVQGPGLPRRLIDTALPAGPAAEDVARDRYCAALDLRRRPELELTVALVE